MESLIRFFLPKITFVKSNLKTAISSTHFCIDSIITVLGWMKTAIIVIIIIIMHVVISALSIWPHAFI